MMKFKLFFKECKIVRFIGTFTADEITSFDGIFDRFCSGDDFDAWVEPVSVPEAGK